MFYYPLFSHDSSIHHHAASYNSRSVTIHNQWGLVSICLSSSHKRIADNWDKKISTRKPKNKEFPWGHWAIWIVGLRGHSLHVSNLIFVMGARSTSTGILSLHGAKLFETYAPPVQLQLRDISVMTMWAVQHLLTVRFGESKLNHCSPQVFLLLLFTV